MQDVTDLPFMRVMARYGGADLYVTEYFRVHKESHLSKWILRSITENPTGRPVFAQMIGNDEEVLVRNAKRLMEYDIAGVDLNLGCPAPTVYKKCAGGGLLREPQRIDRILGALRETIPGRFTVKTRVGFDTEQEFDNLLDVFARHEIDALTIHGRTVVGRYQTPVFPAPIKAAVERLSCPVIANGNVVDTVTGQSLLKQTGAAGLMLGRGAIRNPWLFDQLRAAWDGLDVPRPSHRDLHGYLSLLWEETAREKKKFDARKHTNKMKKYGVYIAQGVGRKFEEKLRRADGQEAFFGICDDYLLNDKALPVLPPEDSKLFCGFGELLKDN